MLFTTHDPYIEKDEIITYNLYRITNSENVTVKSECFICYERIYIKHLISKLINTIKYSRGCGCNGLIHAHCFDEWFKLKNTCPICRTRITKNNYFCNMTNIKVDYDIFLKNYWKTKLINFFICIYLLYLQITIANELYR
jgi:hypothetical protein